MNEFDMNSMGIQHSIDKLNTILPDRDAINGSEFNISVNAPIEMDFSGKSMKRVYIKGGRFYKCTFKSTAAAGSVFISTEMSKCVIEGANFQFCNFDRVIFQKSRIRYSNFSHSKFINCTFINVYLTESTLYDCYFENCCFIKSMISKDTFENTSLHICRFEYINLSRANLEYLYFDRVTLNHVILPPYQIPYVIGLPSYLINTNDSVFIYTDKGKLAVKQYRELYGDLINKYIKLGEYFPVANLLCAMGRMSEAFDYIKIGIKEASSIPDFRTIKHFCRLACTSKGFSHIQLKELYDGITAASHDLSWDANTLHFYMINIGEIRELLLNSMVNGQQIDITIKTSIPREDTEMINALYTKLDVIIKQCCTSEHISAIELRHNSPYELLISCTDMLPNLILLVFFIYQVFGVADKVLNKFLSTYQNVRGIKKLNLDIVDKQLEITAKELQIEMQRIELDKKRKGLTESSSTSPILLVNEIEHTMHCNTIDIAHSVSSECLHFKYKTS